MDSEYNNPKSDLPYDNVSGLQGWVDCFEKAELKGLVTGGEIGAPNDEVNHREIMQKAFELGRSL